ncbi:MarR family winged helix-turn-helix transcriptional regulator [Shouchella sp. JSM 1781072]|uniref:MarR family winged helix-turn-helix transcriptional regulator n=1 Tax=Bacillaceae TaxID=186817 RepID=UPI000C084CA8|nr:MULTISPECIES: MarR family transcriptional regulator [Bacillaceae]UTR05983.1 MarR family transcriptional regulator [Alkalihalobacillus sp. LMS6]
MKQNDKTKEEVLALLVWFRLSRTYHQSLKRSNTFLKKWGLTVAQFDVLVQVGTHKRLSQLDLANTLLVTKGNITKLLTKMEENGWILREKEKKSKYLSLAPKGQDLYNEIVPQQEQHQAAYFDRLDGEELKQLHELLKKVGEPQET